MSGARLVRSLVIAAMLAATATLVQAGDEDAPVPARRAELARDAICATHLAGDAFAAGPKAIAYFTSCLVPGWPTTLRYVDTARPSSPDTLQLPGPEPAMLGFDDEGRLTWATTRAGTGNSATSRLSVYRFNAQAHSSTRVASADLHGPSNVIRVLEGSGCWLVKTVGGQSTDIALVSKRDGVASVDAAGEASRPLFWDSAGAAFVTVSSAKATATWSTIDCAGVRRPLRPSLQALLGGIHAPHSMYFSSPHSDLVLVSLLSDAKAQGGPGVAAFTTRDDRRVDVEDLLGERTIRFNGFAASGAMAAIVTEERIHVLRAGRPFRTIAINRGWYDGLGFTGQASKLAMYVDRGVHLIGMEN